MSAAAPETVDPSSDDLASGTPRKKHRHDLGHEDHGPVLAVRTTKAIQILLGMWIAATMLLVLVALIDSAT